MPSWLAMVRTGGRRRPGASCPQTMPYSMTPRSWVPRGTGRSGSTLKGMKLAETVFLQTITRLVVLQAGPAHQPESHPANTCLFAAAAKLTPGESCGVIADYNNQEIHD